MTNQPTPLDRIRLFTLSILQAIEAIEAEIGDGPLPLPGDYLNDLVADLQEADSTIWAARDDVREALA